MRNDLPTESRRLAVLIDAENVSQALIDLTLEKVAEFGPAKVLRIYGDWSKPQLLVWKDKLTRFAIRPVQQFSYIQGKNASDIALIIDAMDQLYSGNFDCFCLVSSDSDFIPLACRLRESGIKVYGIGENKTPEPFRHACNEFVVVESPDLEESQNEPKAVNGESRNVTASDGLSELTTGPVAPIAEASVEASPGTESDEDIHRFCGNLLKHCHNIREKIKKKQKVPTNEPTKTALGIQIEKLLALCAKAPMICGNIGDSIKQKKDTDVSTVPSSPLASLILPDLGTENSPS